MSNFDVNCPIGYGTITFVGGGTGRHCPVSGEEYCVKCNVRAKEEGKKDNLPRERTDAKQ